MTPPNQIRIIGGIWKSRRLRVAGGVRPSPDAVRETLFNWLEQTPLDGKHCLDLFAGSGAFGFEAVSRGAAAATLVECAPKALGALRANREALRAGQQVEIVGARVEWFLRADRREQHPHGYDLVFLDPPFAARHIQTTCERLRAGGFLNPAALVYIESAAGAAPPIPPGWRRIRQKRRGMVQSTLIQI